MVSNVVILSTPGLQESMVRDGHVLTFIALKKPLRQRLFCRSCGLNAFHFLFCVALHFDLKQFQLYSWRLHSRVRVALHLRGRGISPLCVRSFFASGVLLAPAFCWDASRSVSRIKKKQNTHRFGLIHFSLRFKLACAFRT